MSQRSSNQPRRSGRVNKPYKKNVSQKSTNHALSHNSNTGAGTNENIGNSLDLSTQMTASNTETNNIENEAISQHHLPSSKQFNIECDDDCILIEPTIEVIEVLDDDKAVQVNLPRKRKQGGKTANMSLQGSGVETRSCTARNKGANTPE